MSTHRSRARRPGTLPSDDRSPRSSTQIRDDGRRRITGATSLSALGGTALAVVFGALFAQGTSAAAPAETAPTAPPAAPLVQEAQAVLGTTGAHQHGDTAPPAPTTTAAPPATTSKQSTSKQSTSKPPATARQTTDAPAPPTVAPRTTAGKPTASSGGS